MVIKIRQATIIIIQEILVYKQQDEPDKLEKKKDILLDRNAPVQTDWSWSSDGRKTVIENDRESNVIFWILMWKMKWMGDGML